ncbi:hypothetical protein PsB1_0925 [Candidatus Phycosocius spiralis]|uniref:Transposase n=1 Tax=Candidatus Phycosocius spiralis TaxID=2815099 RepID=A0ABQ4PUX5_9PROT|nr:hypothetical protein PsB1_0925 [Candidatus Phycosocius spiralis]
MTARARMGVLKVERARSQLIMLMFERAIGKLRHSIVMVKRFKSKLDWSDPSVKWCQLHPNAQVPTTWE